MRLNSIKYKIMGGGVHWDGKERGERERGRDTGGDCRERRYVKIQPTVIWVMQLNNLCEKHVTYPSSKLYNQASNFRCRMSDHEKYYLVVVYYIQITFTVLVNNAPNVLRRTWRMVLCSATMHAACRDVRDVRAKRYKPIRGKRLNAHWDEERPGPKPVYHTALIGLVNCSAYLY